MTWRVGEFFEADNGRYSMMRLLTFLSFFPASYVVFKNADGMTSPEILGVYLGAYVLGYVGGKTCDAFNRKGQGDGSINNSGDS